MNVEPAPLIRVVSAKAKDVIIAIATTKAKIFFIIRSPFILNIVIPAKAGIQLKFKIQIHLEQIFRSRLAHVTLAGPFVAL